MQQIEAPGDGMIFVRFGDAGELDRSNYYGTHKEAAGAIHFSAGPRRRVHLLVPRGIGAETVREMGTGRRVVASRTAGARGEPQVELLFDDGTATPFLVTLGAESAAFVPAASDAGKEFTFAAYEFDPAAPDRPRKVLELPLAVAWPGA